MTRYRPCYVSLQDGLYRLEKILVDSHIPFPEPSSIIGLTIAAHSHQFGIVDTSGAAHRVSSSTCKRTVQGMADCTS